jgi:hypothetical protein
VDSRKVGHQTAGRECTGRNPTCTKTGSPSGHPPEGMDGDVGQRLTVGVGATSRFGPLVEALPARVAPATEVAPLSVTGPRGTAMRFGSGVGVGGGGVATGGAVPGRIPIVPPGLGWLAPTTGSNAPMLVSGTPAGAGFGWATAFNGTPPGRPAACAGPLRSAAAAATARNMSTMERWSGGSPRSRASGHPACPPSCPARSWTKSPRFLVRQASSGSH